MGYGTETGMHRNQVSASDLPAKPRPPRPRRARNSVSHSGLPLALPLTRAAVSRDAVATAAAELGSCTTELVLQQMGYPVTRANEMATAAHLKALGFRKFRMSIKGLRAYVFFPPEQ